MHNHCSYKIDTDLHTELLKSFRDMVQHSCAIKLVNSLFMWIVLARMSHLPYSRVTDQRLHQHEGYTYFSRQLQTMMH